jgi:ABC-2 type transport system ATP-binding protein
METIAYEIQNLFKSYPGQPQPANNNISLQIYRGEIFGILGDNGAGKSTLVRQMVNLLRSDAGTIALFGKNLLEHPQWVQGNVGYMPQESSALNNLTVGEALYFTAHLRGLSRSSARQECTELLKLWQIEELRHQPSSQLSGGQKRLLRLAVAMAGSLPVLILDEPTNDLDPQRRHLVWEILRRLNRDRGTTIILITHDAIEAEKAIQRVGILHEGQLVAIGRPSDLKQQVDRKLRLELFFPPETPPTLADGLNYYPIAVGHWRVLLDWSQVASAIASLNPDRLEDFRLYSATLEDLYLHYVTGANKIARSCSTPDS